MALLSATTLLAMPAIVKSMGLSERPTAPVSSVAGSCGGTTINGVAIGWRSTHPRRQASVPAFVGLSYTERQDRLRTEPPPLPVQPMIAVRPLDARCRPVFGGRQRRLAGDRDPPCRTWDQLRRLHDAFRRRLLVERLSISQPGGQSLVRECKGAITWEADP